MRMDDDALHERIILLEEQAIHDWQTRHAPVIVGWLAKRGIPMADAEEIWNDVLGATVKAAPNLNPRGISLRRYAFRVARNLAADRRETLTRQTMEPLDEGLAEQHSRLTPPDPRRVGALRRCLESALPRDRLVMELTSDGATVDELASLLAIEPGSVYQVQRRARVRLQQCIEEELAQ
jgi:RNA polymerase sigma factor (sigma-70 family)